MKDSNIYEKTSNYIKETVIRIDKIQKEVALDSTSTCIFCETSLLSASYNTIPVTLKSISGEAITGNLGVSDDTTNYFRIESIRQDEFVTLRLLKKNDTTLEATEYTMLLDLNYIIAIQCYQPISITLCSENTN